MTSANFAPTNDFTHTLLEVSLTGIIVFRPVYDGAATIQDFTYDYLNPAAQHMLRQPQQPAESFLTLYPTAREEGVFAFYAAAFVSGQAERTQFYYQHDGLDGYFHLVAKRSGEQLVVSFSDANDQPRTEVEEGLRESQARARIAHQEVESQRHQLYSMFEQAPAMICIFDGPAHTFQFVNPPYQALVGDRPLVGRPIAEAMPELDGQPIFGLLDHVYQTGETFYASEMLVQLDHQNEDRQQLEERYYNFIYQARYNVAGRIDGILVFAYEVTPQVVARQQVQVLNDNLAALNQELTTSNEEYLLANTALAEAQQQLRQLNEELEVRVQQRTQEREASYRATELLQAELLAAAQAQVQQREDLYQLFEQTPAGVLLLRGPQHRIEYVNPAGRQLFRGRFLQGRLVSEGMPEVEAQGFIALLNHVYQTGKTYLGNEVPLVVELADGQLAPTTYLNFSYQAYREQDQIVGISVFAYDVTEQVLAKQQRENQQLQLQLVFAQSPVAICVFDGPAYVLALVNPLMGEMLGHEPANLIGRPFFEALPELVSQGLPDLLNEVRRTGVPFSARAQPIRLARHKAGEIGYFNFVYQPLHATTGLQGVVCVATEVTDQVLAGQQVQTLNEELAAINEAMQATNEELHASNNQLLRTNADLDNFIYTASHDLRSPISNIEGLLALLPDVLPAAVRTDTLVAELLTRMQESAERFKRTIGHLTEVSKLQAEFDQPSTPVFLAAVIEDVRQDMLLLLTEARAQLDVDVDGAEPRVFSAKNLHSILYNLLSNALKYRAPDRALRVRVACVPVGTELVLTVQDNGLGMSPGQQTRLFQLFQRLHTHVEGTGVGLYMVKKIVEQAGGTIAVASQEGIGSTFTLRFPA